MSVDEYLPIRISTLRGDIQISFDVYVKVGPKFIHYCRRGSSFEGDRLARLKGKKLKDVYIRAADEAAYARYLTASIDAAYAPGRPLSVRAEVIQGFQQAAAERFMDDPGDEDGYRHLRASAERFVGFLEQEPFGVGALLAIETIDRGIGQHSVNVAALAVAITLRQNLAAGTPKHLLAAGCLIHDLDHQRSGRDVSRPIAGLAPEERRDYASHPMAGAALLQRVTFVDQLVLNIVAQHEETATGTGYPQKLFAEKMDPLVLIAGAANAYDRMITFEGLAPKDALKALLIGKMGEYPLDVLQALQAVLKTQELV